MKSKIEDNDLKISEELLNWYDANKRVLPWRASSYKFSNSYHVLLSEIMLQQTLVATVIPYFLNFIKKWPTIKHLASADFNSITSAWAGLGYYRRAKNLHETAKIISSEYNGNIPNDMQKLLALPGIGNYTASAITAIAFNANANVVDGNIERIFSRLYRIETPLETSKNFIKNISSKHIPHTRNGDYAQALMDLGATICISKTPRCSKCPIIFACDVGAKDEATHYPKRLLKKIKNTRYGLFFCLLDNQGDLLFATNDNRGLLANMDVIPSIGWNGNEGMMISPPSLVTKELSLFNLEWEILPNKITHIFSHFSLDCTIAYCFIKNKKDLQLKSPYRFVNKLDFKKLGLPSLMKKIINLINKSKLDKC